MKPKLMKTYRCKIIVIVLFSALLAIGSVYYYARHVEPNLLQLEKVTIRMSSVTADLDGLRIVQISDLHLGPFYSADRLSRLVDKINSLKPDLIAFTGDLFDNYRTYPGDPGQIPQILGRLSASLGKFAVYGNHDQGGGAKIRYTKLMNQAGFQVLINDHVVLGRGTSRIYVAGLDDFLLGSPDIQRTLERVSPGMFVLLLVHEPDVADRLTPYRVDLQLSGHSHGGQVRLPGIGSLYPPPLARKYTAGMYTFAGSRHTPDVLYVNRGVGTTRLPLRLLNEPEVTILTLRQP